MLYLDEDDVTLSWAWSKFTLFTVYKLYLQHQQVVKCADWWFL